MVSKWSTLSLLLPHGELVTRQRGSPGYINMIQKQTIESEAKKKLEFIHD